MQIDIQIKSMLHINGHGSVLSGEILVGKVMTGQRVAVVSPAQSALATLHGIEIDNALVLSARSGQQASFLFNELEIESLHSGYTRHENGSYTVNSLSITQASKPWWQVW